MGRKPKPIPHTEEDIIALEKLTQEADDWRLSVRARIVLLSLQGWKIDDIAEELNQQSSTVVRWRKRFAEGGIPALSTRPPSKSQSTGEKNSGPDPFVLIDRMLASLPPEGHTAWTAELLSEELNIPAELVSIYLDLIKYDPKRTENYIQRYVSPTALAIENKAEDADDKIDMEITIRLTGEDGVVIERTVSFNHFLPNTETFDLSTREGFLRDFDELESKLCFAGEVIRGQTREAAKEYLEKKAENNSEKSACEEEDPS